jgi:hypothetical protein
MPGVGATLAYTEVVTTPNRKVAHPLHCFYTRPGFEPTTMMLCGYERIGARGEADKVARLSD